MIIVDVSTRCFPTTISGNHISPIPYTNLPPDRRVWMKIKEFFAHTHQSEVLECIRIIHHPPLGITRKDISNIFEQLRMLAYSGYQENIQSHRNKKNHFCILNVNNDEMLSVTFDDSSSYTLEYDGYRKTYATATLPQTAEDYEAIWCAWEQAALPGELSCRTAVVQKMRDCLHGSCTALHLRDLNLTALPDHLPPDLTTLKIENTKLTQLPALPLFLEYLEVINTPLTHLPPLPSEFLSLEMDNIDQIKLPELPPGFLSHEINDIKPEGLPGWPLRLHPPEVGNHLPELPSGLRVLKIMNTSLTSLSTLPSGLHNLEVSDTPLVSLPEVPSGLHNLEVNNTLLTHMPPLPSRLHGLNVRISHSADAKEHNLRPLLQSKTSRQQTFR